MARNISSLFGTLRTTLGYFTEEISQYRAIRAVDNIPRRDVGEILASSGVERARLASLKDTNLWNYLISRAHNKDLISLCLICQISKPKVVFEIGTMRGRTALHLALNTPDDATIYTLDLPLEDDALPTLETTTGDDVLVKLHAARKDLCCKNTEAGAKIVRLFGDSATFDYSDFYGKVGFFFIDGAHSYEYIRTDTLNALKCCYPGGVIAWHDFGRRGWSDVSRWLLEFSRDHDIYAVPGGSLAYMVVSG